MAKYTPAFLHANLVHIYIVQTLTFYDRPAGGVVDDTVPAVYLTAPLLRDREREVPHRARVFHHEFSSILYRHHATQFPDKVWRCTNAAQFTYESSQSGRRNLYTKLSNTRFNPDLYAQGFVCFYGQTTLEDDFNTFAELFLAYPEEARALAAIYPRMRQKLELIQGFMPLLGLYRHHNPKQQWQAWAAGG